MAESRSIGSAGASDSTMATKRNVLRIADDSLAAEAVHEEEEEEASTLSDLSESKVCAKEFWERFAYFLMHDYKAKGNRNNDRQIQFSSAEQTLRKLMHIAKEKFYDTGTLATTRASTETAERNTPRG